MSHERGPTGPEGAPAPRPTADDGVVARVLRHLRTWSERYVEMRVRAVGGNASRGGIESSER
ncbi:hypothetical protein [Halogeometricum luteum]|uniref:Uncharacterized protein n=1 Tax=Halogeometricum luteum TaxID=2950537 RepID=A0ABU2G6W8_9EURY|nr:hypothetical protein [Halogeometricum sp. S3BR5-2]MDS0296044.1 hypothetical protein [Halogeometricum sp. S3BR5-2]